MSERVCRNCGGRLYDGDDPYQIDELVCRECQRSPAVQMRVLLERARDRLMPFDEAWVWAIGEQFVREDKLIDFRGGRVRWPHDTTHRIEWKQILGSRKDREVWRRSYLRQPAGEREKTLVNLAVAA